MNRTRMAMAAALTIAVGPALGCSIRIDGTNDDDGAGDDAGDGGAQEDRFYEVENLVTDTDTDAEHTDRNLVNPWGLAFGPDTFFWVANNGTSTSTLYDGNGRIQSNLIGGPIDIPMPADMLGATEDDEEEEAPGPTGLVYHGGDGFEVEDGVPSRFIFATTAGTIVGWSGEAENPRAAVMLVDNSTAGAVYTGLAITRGDDPLLFAANFADADIDVFDADFTSVELGGDAFVDPLLPAQYAPFGIQEIDGKVYVAYAMKDPEGDEELTGSGRGWVSVYDDHGKFVDRIDTIRALNAPWGLVMAPDEFGEFGGALLVGNFGDGRITAFDAEDYQMLGQLESSDGKPIAIDGLWALAFGNDMMAGESEDLYFTAGPDEEMHGVFGEIAVAGESDED